MADLASLSIKVDSRDISRAKSELDGLSNSAGKAEQSAQKASSAFASMANTLKAAAAALATFQAATVLVRFSDEATKLTAQLKLATRSTEEFARAQADVQRIARIAQQDINATGVLYARLANSLRDLGANQTQIASVTESVALALKVSGASAQEASSAMLQLSQAFASGVLRGEEFNSVSEAAPRLMRLLADSLNVPIGKLREMAQNGELTADKVANALIPAVDQLRKEAQQTATISGAFTVLRNEVVSFVAELNKISAVGENLQRSVPLWTGALQAGLKGIAIVGLTVKVVFEALGTAIGAIAAAVMFLVNGEFANAANVMKNFAGDVMNMGKGFIDATKAVLDYEPATGAAATTTELLANTTSKADKAAEKAAKAYAKLRDTFAAQVQDLMRYIALVQQGVSVEEANLRVQLERQGALQGEIQTIVDLTAERDALTQTIEGEAKARQELADNIEAQRKAALRDAESIEQQAKAQVIANEAYGQTGVAIAILTERRNLDRAAELERFAAIVQGTDPQLAEAYMRQAEAIRELADARIEAAGKAEDAERAKKQLEDQTKEARKLEDVFRDVGRSLTDSLFRGFESGKGFLRSFKDAVVNSFKSLVVRFAVQPVLTSVVGSIAGALGFSGGAQASGGAGGAAGNLQNLTGLAGIAQSITGGVIGTLGSVSAAFGNIGFQSGQAFLAGVSNSLQGGVGTFASAGAGSTAFQVGQFAGKALPFLPGVFSLLEGNFVKAATQTAGTAIGLAIGGPIGGAIGSFIGGLFGNSGPKAVRTTINETAPGQFERLQGKAGFLDNGKVDPTLTAINKQFRDTLESLLGASADTIRISTSAGLFDNRERSSARFRVKDELGEVISEIDLQGSAKKLGENIGKLAEQSLGVPLRDAFLALSEDVTPAIREFLNAVEQPEELQARLQGIVALVNAQDILAEKFAITKDQVVQIANLTGDLNGVIGQLNSRIGEQFITQKLADDATAELTKQFADLGLTLPNSSEAMNELIRAVDKTTPAGIELTNTLLGLAGAVDANLAAQAQLKALTDGMRSVGVEAEITQELLAGSGGYGNLLAGLNALFADQTPVEQFADVTQNLAKAFADVGSVLPTTRAEMLQLIQTAGPELKGALIALYPAFTELIAAGEALNPTLQDVAANVLTVEEANDQLRSGYEALVSALDDATASLIDAYGRQGQAIQDAVSALQNGLAAEIGRQQDIVAAADRARDAYVAGLQREQGTLRQVADQFRAFSRSLRDTAAEVLGIAASDGSPNALRQQFASVSARARLGDADALEQLPRLASALANELPDFAVSREQLSNDLALVSESLKLAADTADRTVAINESQASSQQSIIDELVGAEPTLEALRVAYEQAKKAGNAAQIALDDLNAELAALSGRQSPLNVLRANLAALVPAGSTANAELAILQAKIDALQPPVLAVNDALTAYNAALAEQQSALQSIKDAGFESVLTDVAQGVTALIDQVRAAGAAAAPASAGGTAVDVGGIIADANAGVVRNSIENPIVRTSDRVRAENQVVEFLQNGFGSFNDLDPLAQTIIGNLATANNDAELLARIAAPVPGFAAGGMFGGGLRLVGERGPELEFTGPSRIFSNSQSADMLRPDMSGLEERMEGLERAIFQVAKNTGKTSDLLRDWDDGGRMNVRVEATAA